MTREEAIKGLKVLRRDFSGYNLNEEMFDMAIEALEQEQERQKDIYECRNCLGEVHKNYVYCPFCGRKVDEGITMTTHGVIKILRNTAWLGTNEDREKIEQAVEVVAKALEQEPIIHCKNCKYWHEWENRTGSCRRSSMIWEGTDYDDYCSFAERKEDTEE